MLLAQHFLARACSDYGLPAKTLSADAVAALTAYRWPGNVRELINTMERVALLTEGAVVTADLLALDPSLPGSTETPASEEATGSSSLAAVVDGAEPDRQHQPSAGEAIDGRRLARDLPRLAPGQRLDDGPQRHSLGDHREGRHEGERVRDRDVVADMDAVPGEDAVPAARLRLASQLDLLRCRAAGQDVAEAHQRAVAA